MVIPYYEAQKVYSLIIPESAKNPMSQQGLVVEVGPKQKVIKPGDYILYHPFSGVLLPWRTPNNEELLLFAPSSIAGWFIRGEIYPLPGFVVIKPRFRDNGPSRRGSVFTVGQVFHVEPPDTGDVRRIGLEVETVRVGDIVVFPVYGENGRQDKVGHEIGIDNGFSRQVVYVIHESDLLARLVNASD